MWSVPFPILAVILSVLQRVTGDDNRCFRLDGSNDSYVIFENTNDISRSLHFKLKFRTSGANQLIYYNEGSYEEDKPLDYEGVFIKNGYLTYFGFNPTPYGAGESFGSFTRTNFRVDNDTWFEMEFFRNMEKTVQDFGMETTIMITGMIVNGREFPSQGGLRVSMDLGSELWIGGHENLNRISKNLSCFSGDIKNFYDVTNSIPFDTPVEGRGNFVDGTCIDIPPPA